MAAQHNTSGSTRRRTRGAPDVPAPVAFSATSFVVPGHYLALLVGPAAATRLVARAKEVRGKMADDAPMPSVTFLKLCLEYMRTTGDESYGNAAKPVPKGTLGIVMAASAQGRNFGEALKRLATAAALLRPDLKVRYVRSRNGLDLTIAYAGKPSARKELVVEIFALSLHCALRWLTGQSLRLVQARLAAPHGAFDKTVLRGVLGCPTLRKGSGVTMSYRPADATLPLADVKYNTWAAHEFGAFMRLLDEAAAERHVLAREPALPIVRDVQAVLLAGLRGEDDVARSLRMSPATLRRRLSDAGSSFRVVLDDVQRAAAAALLMTDKRLEDIAAEVKYSDARSFRRACRRWFGMTPSAYRGQALSTAPARQR